MSAASDKTGPYRLWPRRLRDPGTKCRRRLSCSKGKKKRKSGKRNSSKEGSSSRTKLTADTGLTGITLRPYQTDISNENISNMNDLQINFIMGMT